MEILRALVGKKVKIYTISEDMERSDIGILEEFDHQMIRIRKNEHEVLFFTIGWVRLIKPFDPM